MAKPVKLKGTKEALEDILSILTERMGPALRYDIFRMPDATVNQLHNLGMLSIPAAAAAGGTLGYMAAKKEDAPEITPHVPVQAPNDFLSNLMYRLAAAAAGDMEKTADIRDWFTPQATEELLTSEKVQKGITGLKRMGVTAPIIGMLAYSVANAYTPRNAGPENPSEIIYRVY